MTNCIFCRIIERSVPCEILFENASSISILDNRPIHFGHALILPKQHYASFLEVPLPALVGLTEATRTICEALTRSLNLEGFNIFCNNGAAAGQSVFHFHWHVTPRYRNDNIRFELSLKKYSDGEMAHFARRIREQINGTA
jgi:histidine triad (HIT) family protein